MKNLNINTCVQYEIILKKCKLFFENELTKIFQEKKKLRRNNINNIILSNVYNNKWTNVINLSVIAILFYDKNILNTKILKSTTIKDIYNYYDVCLEKAKFLMKKKNLDYGEAWKMMKLSSMKDIIIQKVLRIQNMEKNYFIIKNFFEKIFDNYIDILNYCIFILIRIEVY